MYFKDFDNWNSLKKKINNLNKDLFFKEREVWWLRLGVNVGHELDGKGCEYARPFLILKKTGKYTFLALPFTRSKKNRKEHVVVDFKGTRSTIVLSGIRVFDYRRLMKKMGRINSDTFHRIEKEFIQYILKKI